jgi:hypothetical protein
VFTVRHTLNCVYHLHERQTSNVLTPCNFSTTRTMWERFYNIKGPEQACHQNSSVNFCKQTIHYFAFKNPEMLSH